VGGCCWCQKETLRDLWSQTDAPTAIKFFKEWCRSLIHTKLEPMKAVAWTIKERLGNVVSYCTHRITNSVAERMNGKIMSMKCRVGGFRNVESFKTAIFFYCGGLDL
jgi:transposase